MKLKELLNDWLQKYIKHSIKLRTFLLYQGIIKNHIVPILGEYKLHDLSPKIIQNFISSKIEDGNLSNKQKLSYNTVYSITSVLKQVLKYAFSLSLLPKDLLTTIKLPPVSEKKIEIFETFEQQKIENYCLFSKPNYIGIVLCLYTGIRIGELLALTWEDIDLENKIISINKSLSILKIKGSSSKHIDKPKTKSSVRIIPIPKQLIPFIKKIKKTSQSKYLISTRNNEMVDIRSYQRSFEAMQKRLNIKYRNFHSLRHTFATRALELGMDVKTLSEILGHNNATVTLNRYTHSLLEYKKEMINKLGKNIDNKCFKN